MLWHVRLRIAARAALIHLGFSLVLACAVAWLVFGVWFPAPLDELTGGLSLFFILMAVDVVCGPVLTLVLYNPVKSRLKWRLDLTLIMLTQLAALWYGLHQVSSARPVFVAFEGDRFRLVQAGDVDTTQLQQAPAGLRSLGYSGPRMIGVQLAAPGDMDYLSSLQLSIQGLHPAFRPARWQPLLKQLPSLRQALHPVAALRAKNPQAKDKVSVELARLSIEEDQLGYLPLVCNEITDWVVLVKRSTGEVVAYLHLDGW